MEKQEQGTPAPQTPEDPIVKQLRAIANALNLIAVMLAIGQCQNMAQNKEAKALGDIASELRLMRESAK